FSSRRRHTRSKRDWSSDVCSSDLAKAKLWETIIGSKKFEKELINRLPVLGKAIDINCVRTVLLCSKNLKKCLRTGTILFLLKITSRYIHEASSPKIILMIDPVAANSIPYSSSYLFRQYILLILITCDNTLVICYDIY